MTFVVAKMPNENDFNLWNELSGYHVNKCIVKNDFLLVNFLSFFEFHNNKIKNEFFFTELPSLVHMLGHTQKQYFTVLQNGTA